MSWGFRQFAMRSVVSTLGSHPCRLLLHLPMPPPTRLVLFNRTARSVSRESKFRLASSSSSGVSVNHYNWYSADITLVLSFSRSRSLSRCLLLFPFVCSSEGWEERGNEVTRLKTKTETSSLLATPSRFPVPFSAVPPSNRITLLSSVCSGATSIVRYPLAFKYSASNKNSLHNLWRIYSRLSEPTPGPARNVCWLVL